MQKDLITDAHPIRLLSAETPMRLDRPPLATQPSMQLDLESGTICQWTWAFYIQPFSDSCLRRFYLVCGTKGKREPPFKLRFTYFITLFELHEYIQ